MKLPQDVMTILSRLRDGGWEAFVVGGCVRDLLMGKEPHDWDICTSALPQETRACFPELSVVETGIRHGTVLLLLNGVGYEVTTYRTEGAYSDHRHPDGVRFVRAVREDLARRDFTINAMAYHPETGVVDPFGGREDLQKGVLRCVGNPEERFREDPLRILRLLRFAARLGFAVEPETARGALALRGELDYIARERVFAELKGLLVGEYVLPVLREGREVLAQCIPELVPMFDHPQDNPHHCYDIWGHTIHTVAAVEPTETLRLTMLFHDIGKPDCFTHDEAGIGHFHGHPARSVQLAEEILTRLRCDSRTKEDVLALVAWHDRLRVFHRRSLCRVLRELGERRTRLLFPVLRADAMGKAPAYRERDLQAIAEGEALLDALLREGLCLSLRDLQVNGRDIAALGCTGQEIGRVLGALLEEVQEERLENRREVLLRRAGALASCPDSSEQYSKKNLQKY